MKLKKGDLIIIIILIVAAVSWYGINMLDKSKNEKQVVIEIDGDVYKSVPMNAGMRPQEVHVDLANGKYIDIMIDGNGTYVKDVICPDKVCQKTGVVNKVGQSIVCLPNKVMVYVEGEAEGGTKYEVDNVSY